MCTQVCWEDRDLLSLVHMFASGIWRCEAEIEEWGRSGQGGTYLPPNSVNHMRGHCAKPLWTFVTAVLLSLAELTQTALQNYQTQRQLLRHFILSYFVTLRSWPYRLEIGIANTYKNTALFAPTSSRWGFLWHCIPASTDCCPPFRYRPYFLVQGVLILIILICFPLILMMMSTFSHVCRPSAHLIWKDICSAFLIFWWRFYNWVLCRSWFLYVGC